ncbi:MAG TPA: hypothetical protein PLJ35_05660 [Anaerolineae bacterium]|nr:hypothetical protein [Anaerolineae bacterium]HOG45292.1 hypothetical protein [Anaerolineae bacterium]HOQ98289.1 hypothetical protein [Anaerolineae bacterium]HPL30802.1 hypothetical protein [Anaerolineae bacterium]
MWRPEEAEDALDQCLARLQRGEPAEACLVAYPHLAAELAPLLAVARRLLLAAACPHDPAPALARIRARFLQRIGED